MTDCTECSHGCKNAMAECPFFSLKALASGTRILYGTDMGDIQSFSVRNTYEYRETYSELRLSPTLHRQMLRILPAHAYRRDEARGVNITQIYGIDVVVRPDFPENTFSITYAGGERVQEVQHDLFMNALSDAIAWIRSQGFDPRVPYRRIIPSNRGLYTEIMRRHAEDGSIVIPQNAEISFIDDLTIGDSMSGHEEGLNDTFMEREDLNNSDHDHVDEEGFRT